MPGSFRFDRFLLDPGNRQLTRDGEPQDLNARYLDALVLLVREQGKLVSKDRFLEEVWQGVPVTDEALTQCIKTLRRVLGDDAANPRFIETVPKHGYRFIAPIAPDDGAARAGAPTLARTSDVLRIGGAGTIGGGVAGLFGGLFYGFFAVSSPADGGTGAASMILVLVCLTIVMGSIGAAGVAFGIAAVSAKRSLLWSVGGGAVGGLVVGGVVKLIGLDAFNLLFGQAPGDITGGPEGALLGGAVGLGAWLACGRTSALPLRRGVAIAGGVGAAAGIVIHLLGGRLMAGSLDSLAGRFPNSHVRLDQLGRLFGEDGFGPLSQVVVGGIEGMLFSACVVGAMTLANARPSRPPR